MSPTPRRVLPVLPFLLVGIMLLSSPAWPAASQEASTPAAGTPAVDCPDTTVDENRAMAISVQEMIGAGDMDGFDAMMHPEMTGQHPSTHESAGVEEAKQTYDVLLTGFPDYQATIEDTVAEGDLVAVRWTATGTNLGPFPGIATPTGKQATWSGMQFFRFECGQIVELWTEVDAVARLQQLGIISDAGTAVATPEP